MKVVFLEDVEGVAQGGDIKEVKNGFARNYLIPKALAVPATHDALQRIEKLADNAEKTRLKTLKDMTALGEELSGVRIDVEMRAGTGGRLYGSVTNAIIAAKLAELTGRQIDRRTVTVPDSVRELGVYTANVKLHAEVETEIDILVHPLGTDAEGYLAEMEGRAKDGAEAAGGIDDVTAASAEAEEAEALEASEESSEDEPEATEASIGAEEEPAEAEPEDEPPVAEETVANEAAAEGPEADAEEKSSAELADESEEVEADKATAEEPEAEQEKS